MSFFFNIFFTEWDSFMYRTHKVLLALALCGIQVFCLTSETNLHAAEKPNIVFIMADDLGIGDLGCYNSESKIPTPHMDALAKAGMRFNDAHSPSSVCTPTRNGGLTGRYAWRTRLKSRVLQV